MRLTVLNLDTARFECTFGRGCEGRCCRNGRPPVYVDEARRIDANLHRILPLLRSEVRTTVEKEGYLSRRIKAGQPIARVVAGWCVFFNDGCALHRLGTAEGAPLRYKPGVCAMFPLAKDERDSWYVRQKGYKGERWDLPCLDPASSPIPAACSLQPEIALVEQWESQKPSAGRSD